MIKKHLEGNKDDDIFCPVVWNIAKGKSGTAGMRTFMSMKTYISTPPQKKNPDFFVSSYILNDVPS